MCIKGKFYIYQSKGKHAKWEAEYHRGRAQQRYVKRLGRCGPITETSTLEVSQRATSNSPLLWTDVGKLKPKVEEKRRQLKTEAQAKATAPSSGVGGVTVSLRGKWRDRAQLWGCSLGCCWTSRPELDVVGRTRNTLGRCGERGRD